MSFKEKINNGYKKVSEWYNEHPILGTIIGTVGSGAIVGIGCGIARKRNNNTDKIQEKLDPKLTENWTPGRNCTAKFFVDETGECLGEYKCCESYALEEIDIFNFNSGS